MFMNCDHIMKSFSVVHIDLVQLQNVKDHLFQTLMSLFVRIMGTEV
jgi:hypothetical protein